MFPCSLCMHACMHVCMYVYFPAGYVCMYVCMFSCGFMYLCACVCMDVRACVWNSCMYMYACTHAHIQLFRLFICTIFVHVCMHALQQVCVYMYLCMYIYVQCVHNSSRALDRECYIHTYMHTYIHAYTPYTQDHGMSLCVLCGAIHTYIHTAHTLYTRSR